MKTTFINQKRHRSDASSQTAVVRLSITATIIIRTKDLFPSSGRTPVNVKVTPLESLGGRKYLSRAVAVHIVVIQKELVSDRPVIQIFYITAHDIFRCCPFKFAIFKTVGSVFLSGANKEQQAALVFFR